MTRITVSIDPLPALRAAKKAKVNEGFNWAASQQLHLDQAYAQKREWANHLDGRLYAEAELRGITVQELAKTILSKPDLVAEREAHRQRIMKQIDDAKTVEELEAISG